MVLLKLTKFSNTSAKTEKIFKMIFCAFQGWALSYTKFKRYPEINLLMIFSKRRKGGGIRIVLICSEMCLIITTLRQ